MKGRVKGTCIRLAEKLSLPFASSRVIQYVIPSSGATKDLLLFGVTC